MLSVLHNRTYRHLFFAQVIALTGTGLATVALGLLAYDLAGEQAALVLGGALTVKMVAYVLVAPIAAGIAEQLNRRNMLVVLDIIRATLVLCLPLVTEVWQVYVVIFVMQSASAGFTPVFQATIPDVLSDEAEYTKALSLSRMAMDLESLLSPMLAAILLGVLPFQALFGGAGLGFLASALLVVSVVLPSRKPAKKRGFYKRTTRGLRLYLGTKRLRSLLALSWTISSIGAMVIVNTVVVVRANLGLGESAVAIALAGFGAGSMVAAFWLPRVLETVADRKIMVAGGVLGCAALVFLALQNTIWGVSLWVLVGDWAVIGFGYSLLLTPTGRVLTRACAPEDRPAIFAAQFTLSHACWLVAYMVAGWGMTHLGLTPVLLVLAGSGAAGLLAHGWVRGKNSPRADLPET